MAVEGRQLGLQLASFQKAREAFEDLYVIGPLVAFKGDSVFSKMTIRGSNSIGYSTLLTTWEKDFLKKIIIGLYSPPESIDFSSAFCGKNECFQCTIIKEKTELAEYCLVQSHVLHLTSD